MPICDSDYESEERDQINVTSSSKKESSGYELNDVFWKAVDTVKFDTDDMVSCYKQIANSFAEIGNNYFKNLAIAMTEWSKLYA